MRSCFLSKIFLLLNLLFRVSQANQFYLNERIPVGKYSCYRYSWSHHFQMSQSFPTGAIFPLETKFPQNDKVYHISYSGPSSSTSSTTTLMPSPASRGDEVISAFKHAVAIHNDNRTSYSSAFPHTSLPRYKVDALMDVIDSSDPFKFTRQCKSTSLFRLYFHVSSLFLSHILRGLLKMYTLYPQGIKMKVVCECVLCSIKKYPDESEHSEE